MKVTFCTRDYADVSGGHNTWLCRFLPYLRRRGIESRVLCFPLSPEKEFPTVRSLRQAGFSCTTVSEEEMKYTEQRVRWILERLADDPPHVFVCSAVIPAAYYAGRWLREAGIPTVGICHGGGMCPAKCLKEKPRLGRGLCLGDSSNSSSLSAWCGPSLAD